MSAGATLIDLHRRLIQDRSTPFWPTGVGHNVRVTAEGRAWLLDYERYLRLYYSMERDQQDPAGVLWPGMGALDDEDEPEAPRHVRKSRELVWLKNVPRKGSE